MNVQPLNVTQEQAQAALAEYKLGRAQWDALDKTIMRVYRKIAKGATVICALDAIRKAGVDDKGRPKLAIMRADQAACRADFWSESTMTITNEFGSRAAEWHFEIPWPGRVRFPPSFSHRARALVPRIPPQFRPAVLADYHILWEADWEDIPRDPYLLKRLGPDLWTVLAAWDLTDVEIGVMRGRLRG